MTEEGRSITTTAGEKKEVTHFIRFGMDTEYIAICSDGIYIKREKGEYEKAQQEL